MTAAERTCVRCGRQGTRAFTDTDAGSVCSSTEACRQRAIEAEQAGYRFRRLEYRGSHAYRLDGERVVGVTTVLGVLDKPALVGWAAKQSAGYAVEHWTELGQLPILDRAQKIERARFETNRAAKVRGSRVHGMAEDLAHGRPVEVPPEYVGPVEAYARFLERWDIETVQTETPVCRSDYRYAGTFDLVAKIGRLGMGPVMLDTKTSPRVYSEVALQLAAYRFCDLQLGDKPNVETEAAFVAHVQADTVDLVPIEQDESILATFLYLLEVHERWIKRTGWDFRDADSYRPPVGDPIYPEQAAS